MAEERVQRRLAAILAADMVGYSRLMGEDEAGTLDRLKALRHDVLDPKITAFGGRIVKTMGDGVLVEFPSAVDAVEYAIDTQQALAQRNKSLPEDSRIEFRMGINLGDIIVDGDDIFGDGVNIAARLEGLAGAGGICVSGMVYEGVRGKLEVAFSDIGDQSLKNIASPVHVYRVQLSATDGTDDAAISSDALFRKPAVAVMPFENMSGDPDQEFFADGLTEDLITVLSQWRSFPVIARNSTFAYKGQSPDIRKVGEELGARYVVEGSVRKSGNRLRVTAQLINTDTGHHVWAERYDRDVEEFFDLQDEITRQISAVIAPELDRAEQRRTVGKRPESLDAWECYQRGMSLWQTLKVDEVAEARGLFEQAMALDPTFARAYVGYVLTYHQQTRVGSAETDREKAMQAAGRAIELDSDDASAHFALGLVYFLDRDLEAAISEFENANRLNPSFAPAHALLGNALSGSGRAEEAIPQIEQAIRLNPHDPAIGPIYTRLASAHLFLQRHEVAVKWARQSIRNQASNWPTRAYLASALAHLDRLDEARRALDEMNEIKPGITIEFVRQHTPVTDTGYMDHLLDGLRKAGLPAN
jgi:adenylate cyclase